jgi:5-methylcytosine-specific restriction endonuclease McrA
MTAETTAVRRARLAKAQDGICPECALPLPDDLAGTEIDHIIPRSRGGPDLVWNRRLVHFKCNRSKHTKLTDEAAVLAERYGVTLCQQGELVRPQKPPSKLMQALFTEDEQLKQELIAQWMHSS